MKDRVKTKWSIKLPVKAKILVEVGDIVEQDQVLAESEDLDIKSYNYGEVFKNLGLKTIDELNTKFRNQIVKEGELFCIKQGFFGKKICFPNDGKFLELNEFGNLKIEISLNNKKEIKSPVKAKVSKIEDGKIVLDFWVKDYNGETLIEGKTWGNGGLELINKLDQLGPNMDGKILFTDNLETTFLLKAEVVGVVGIVTNQKKDEFKIKMPVLYVEDEVWQDLFKIKTIENRFLLNSTMGRLLLVLE